MSAALRAGPEATARPRFLLHASRWTRLIPVAAALLLAAFIASGPALAHAVFVSADPPPGAVLPAPPSHVRIVFSEPLNADLSGIVLLDSAGSAIGVNGGGVDPQDGRAYEVDLPVLQPDRYTVTWHTVSLVDGHTRTGSYPFTVLEPDGTQPPISTVIQPPPAQPPTLPDAVLAVAAWFAFIGVTLLASPILVSLVARPPPSAKLDRLAGAFRTAIGLGVILALAGAAIQLLGAALPAGGLSALGSLLGEPFGVGWVVRTIAVLLLAAGWRSNWLDASGRARVGRAVVVGAALAATAATSHGAASAVPVWGFAFDGVHIAAAAVWVGAIVALALGYRLLDPGDQTQATYRLKLLGRISIVAGIAVPLVLLGGLGSAVVELASPADLFDTAYGQTLGLKLLAALALLAVAGLNAVRLRPAAMRGSPAGHHLRRTVVAEVALAVAVVGLAAAMSILVPARSEDATRAAIDQAAADTDPARSFSGSTSVAGAPVTVTMTPATVGTNVVRAETVVDLGGRLILDAVGPDQQQTNVDLDRVGTQPGSDGLIHTVYGGNLTADGAPGGWQLRLSRPGESADGAPLLVPLAAASAGTPVQTPPEPPVQWLALLAIAAIGATGIAAARAVRQPRVRRFVASAGALVVGATIVAGSALAVLPSAPWGTRTAVVPVDTGTATKWVFPTTNAGLMMPTVGPDGTVWVAEMNVNRVAALDPTTRTLRELTFPSPIRSTMGAALDQAGILWLAQEVPDALGRLDPATGDYTEIRVPTPAAAPSGVAVDASGIVWFTELGAGKIGRYDPATEQFREYALGSKDSIPYWLTVGPDGRVWFTELQAAQVGVVDPVSGSVREVATPGGEQPTGIAVDPSGTVWFATTAGSLVQLDPNGLAMTVHKLPTSNGYGVAIGPGGMVWIGSFTDSVYSYDPQSDRIRTYDLGANSQPWWPATAPDGSVWVVLGAEQGNGVAQLSGG